MKKILFACALFASCSPTKIMLMSGQYPETPIVIHSDNSFEKTWDKLVDVFAQKGLNIKIIDRSSGIIISSPYKMTASMERQDGKDLVDPAAYIVVPSIKIMGRWQPITGTTAGPYADINKLKANDVLGEWNVRIKPDGTGSTINININNVTYESMAVSYNSIYSSRVPTQTILSSYKSTGIFERELTDLIK